MYHKKCVYDKRNMNFVTAPQGAETYILSNSKHVKKLFNSIS